MQAFRDRAKRRQITEVRPYLFRMVRNRCTDILRARSRQSGRTAEDAILRHPRYPRFIRLDRRARTGAGTCPPAGENPGTGGRGDRLRAWADLSFVEVALAVGASVPTVKSRFRYGIEKLRRLLNLDEVEAIMRHER